jgi:hypothetical protein
MLSSKLTTSLKTIIKYPFQINTKIIHPWYRPCSYYSYSFFSKEHGIPLQQLLNLFCQEEFIRRLSVSDYKEKVILKGGFLLYSISGFAARPTVDADYLLRNYPSDMDAG